MSGPAPRRVSKLTVLRLVKGRTEWTLDKQAYQIREGQGFLLCPGATFSGLETLDAMPIVVEQIDLSGPLVKPSNLVDSLSKALSLKRGEVELIVGSLLELRSPVIDFDVLGDKLYEDVMLNNPPGNSLDLLRLRSALVALLIRIGSGPGDEVGHFSDSERRVALFLKELEERCDEHWTLDLMAGSTELKRTRFGNLCRLLTGESPAIYLNRLRIRRSRKLLRETGMSVTDIAFECGFSSSQYFAKTFRRFQGHEPTHYRRLSQNLKPGDRIAYVKGDSARVIMIADRNIGSGDFELVCEITLDRLGDTAASLEFGPDRFGFDGREGRLFLEGETFGEIRFFEKSSEIIREGIPFLLNLCRRGKQLSLKIDGRRVVSVLDDPVREIGKVGLRPLRNGIQVKRFEIDGNPVSLLHQEN